MSDHTDENYEKPSRHKQWQEKSEKPVMTRVMTKYQIEELRRNLIASYDCEPEDISYTFHKIKDDDDEDRDDCLWLKYNMKCIRYGKPVVIDIFTIKLPIPDEIKNMGEQIKKQQANRVIQTKALPAPEQTHTSRPKLIKPTLRATTKKNTTDKL